MKVGLSQRALDDLLELSIYLEEVNPRSAERFVARIRRRCDSLEAHPRRGIRIRLPNHGEYRRLVEGTHVIIYRVDATRVLVARVLHGARNIEGLLEDPAFLHDDPE